MTGDALPAEFAALLAEHRGLEPLLAFAVLANATELRQDNPVTAAAMLSWAHGVRAQHSTGDDLCGGSV